MPKQRFIELLAPAKNAETARQAILHGADAVYLGAPHFGARVAAGNSLEAIAGVVREAHAWHVKVYVTMNSLLHDEELQEAEALAWDLWAIGVDALIVQDMGLTKANLPPIPLHASTQTNNRTVEKVQFLEKAGFRQVVLARELSIEQIRTIAEQTTVPLEVFIHGALCVSYSGQCYLSHALGGRSANRGECAQSCRLPYDVLAEDGSILLKQKHVLSLRDFNASDHLEALVDAGVTSFKIEGRLKDPGYVANVTAWYHQALNHLLEKRPSLKRASLGQVRLGFTPNLFKSFNRGFTDYFLQARAPMNNRDTPKSLGEPVGRVNRVFKDRLVLSLTTPLINGDGLSYLGPDGSFAGFRVNRVEGVDGSTVYPATMPGIKEGALLYRTFDQAFERQLERQETRRVLPVKWVCWETNEGFALELSDNDGHRVVRHFSYPKTVAQKPQREQVTTQLSKLGQTRFVLEACCLEWTSEWFVPVSVWGNWRRELCDALEQVIQLSFKREMVVFKPTTHPYPEERLSYMDHVLNEASRAFFTEHGVKEMVWAPEYQASTQYETETTVMINKYCLKYEMGGCPKIASHDSRKPAPASLVYQGRTIQLQFDCKRCEMRLVLEPSRTVEGTAE